MEGEVFTFGRFRVLATRRELWVDGRQVEIGTRALDVLITLVRRPGMLVTKAELIGDVWAGVPVGDNAIAAQVSLLRRVLNEGGDGGRSIQTASGRGYRFVGDLDVASSLSQPVGPATTPGRPRSGRRWGGALLAAAALLLVGGVLALWWMTRPPLWTVESLRTLPTGLDAGFDPSLGPKGALVAFAGREQPGAPSRIFLRGLAPTAQAFALTTAEEDEASPTWSGTGERLALVRQRPGRPCRIIVKDAPAGGETVAGDCAVVETTRLAWAPAAAVLFFVDRQNHTGPTRIMRLDIDTGRRAAVTNPDQRLVGDDLPAVSPDGRWLAFARLDAGQWQAFVQPLPGGPPRPIGTPERDLSGLAWSQDGRTVFLSVQRAGSSAILASARGGGVERQVTLSALEFGRIGSGPGDSLVVETTERTWRVVRGVGAASPPTDGIADDLDISTSGTAAVIVHRGGDSGVYLASPGGEWRRLASVVAKTIYGVRWSPDGRRLLFLADTGSRSGLFTVTLDGAAPTLVASSSMNLVNPGAWMADGQSIIYPLFDGSRWRLWRVAVDGTRPEPASDYGWCGVRESGGDIYAVRTDRGGVWRLGDRPELVAPNHPADHCYAWAVGSGRVAVREDAGPGPLRVLIQRVGGASNRSVAAPGLPGDVEGTTISLDPRTGDLAYLSVTEKRGLAILNLKRSAGVN